ncbi:TolC family protein [bacterium]|nr:TolC family protein [bacterium]
MKVFRILLILTIVLSVFLVTGYASEVGTSLEACIEQAVSSSHSLEASRASVYAASQNQRWSKANRLPTVGLNGKADWVSETMKLDLDIPPNPIFTPPEIEFGDGTNFDLALAVSAPLYTGGSLNNLERSAAEDAKASRFEFASDSLKLVYQVRAAYFQALAAQEAFDLATQAVESLQRHLVEVNGLIEQGMANREARLLTEARLKEAERGLVNAQAGVRSSRLMLGRLTGHTGQEIIPSGDLEQSLIHDDRGSHPISQRPDLLALKARGASGGYRADASRGSLFPTVSAQAAMHYGKPGIDMVSNEWMDYATVGVRLSWTLFDWGQRDSRTQQARAMQDAIQHGRSEAEQAWQTRAKTAHVQLDAAARDHELATERVELYRERLSLLTQRYKQGLATESERLDAEDELTMAQRNRVTAQAKIRLAENELLFTLGK